MTKLQWNLWDDLEPFDLGQVNARPSAYKGHNALYLEGTGSAIFLREKLTFNRFRLQAEVAIPGQVGFIGLVFGAKESHNYELVYLAPVELQYDPIMNDSMTWQIYNGSKYQKPLPNTTSEWVTLSLDVQPNGVAVYLGDDPTPQLVISNLQHGGEIGRIGIWGFLPSYIRNLSIEEIEPTLIEQKTTDLKQLTAETHVTEWMVSEPYLSGESPAMQDNWIQTTVEENGTLNLNRIYRAEPGITVQAKSKFSIPEEQETLLSFGFSDFIRLWINDEEVYEGSWGWNPPVSDGRIRSDYASVPVSFMKIVNQM